MYIIRALISKLVVGPNTNSTLPDNCEYKCMLCFNCTSTIYVLRQAMVVRIKDMLVIQSLKYYHILSTNNVTKLSWRQRRLRRRRWIGCVKERGCIWYRTTVCSLRGRSQIRRLLVVLLRIIYTCVQ
jgi:hypothetical protein